MIASLILCTGLLGLVLLIMKFPAARQLGKLLFTNIAFLVIVLVPDLEVFQICVLVAIAIQLRLYIDSFFNQKTRVSYWNWLPMLTIVALYWTSESIYTIGGLVVIAIYLVLSLRLLSRESEKRGISWFTNPGDRLGWFRDFICLNLVVLISAYWAPAWLLCILVLLVVSMVLYQIVKESNFITPIPLGNKYQKSTLTPHIKVAILSKIEDVMDKGEFYLRDDASLSNLATQLGATTHHLSQVLNESMKISFQDLMARYRIRHACRMLRDPANDQMKIENIASVVGYNSKSAFNTAFKKRTGLTPSEYKESKDVRSYGEERLSDRKIPSGTRGAFSLSHVFNFKMNSDMIQHFFKIFGRNVKRNGLFSFLNILGLSVGFTCSILIYLFISDELSYDKDIADYEQIHRIAWLNENPQTRTPHPMAQAMVNDFPEVDAAVSLSPWYGNGLSKSMVRVKNVEKNIVFEEPDFYFADSTFLDVFQLEVLEGDKDALKQPFALVITKPLAERYFGEESAIGQELQLNDMPIAVTAVVGPMPEHSHFHFQAIIPYVTLKQINPNDSWMKWEDFGHFNYIKLKEGADAAVVESKISEWVVGYLDWGQTDLEILKSGEARFDLQPIADIHLSSHLRWELENNGNILYVYILLVTLVFLILIACINYVNLTTAKSMERAKEIGVRKTLGAVSINLSIQFYFEAILFSVLAMALSLGLALLFLDSFNFLAASAFDLQMILNAPFILKAFSLSIVIGLLAGFYPAIALADFKPSEVLKGKLTTQSKGVRMRSALVVVQFAVSAILITGSLMIFRQIQYMKDKELGFDKEAIVSIDIPISVEHGGLNLPLVYTVQQQIEAIAGVRGTSMMSNIPGGQFNQHPYYPVENPENRVDINNVMVGFGIEKVLGLEITQGRAFDRSFPSDSMTNCIINEVALKQLDIENPIGKSIMYAGAGRNHESKIIGVMRDFHYRSLHQPIEPMIFHVQPLGVSSMLVKFDGSQFGSVIEKVEAAYAELNKDLPFEYRFLDDQMSELYDQEIHTLNIFSVFSLIALLLACLGLLGMAIAILNQRTKEVGMRKILGASASQIMAMFVGQFLRLVVIALVIGLPIAYFLMQQWIAEFSYQAPFGIMPFAWSVVILISVCVLSVVSAIAKIIYANPVNALRYE
jgi:putative ABC transport system permease protein